MATPNERCLEIGETGRLLIEVQGGTIFISLQEIEKVDSSTTRVKAEVTVKAGGDDEKSFNALTKVYDAMEQS